MSDNFEIYVLRTSQPATSQKPRGANAASIDADNEGRILFREKVESSRFEQGLQSCIEAAKRVIAKASEIKQDYRVESVTLKLGIDAEFGVVFIGDASLEAGIEVEIRRA